MDGKSAWRDNVFVERLWRNVKYEEVYLRAYEGVSDARAPIGRYLDFYNGRRPHSSLDGITPDHAYFTPLPLRLGSLTTAELHISKRKNCSDNRVQLLLSARNLRLCNYRRSIRPKARPPRVRSSAFACASCSP